MSKIRIDIVGDNTLTGTICLNDTELNILNRVIGSLKADGPYAPWVRITNLDEKARLTAEQEKAAAEKRAAELAQEERNRKAHEEMQSHMGQFSMADTPAGAKLAALLASMRTA